MKNFKQWIKKVHICSICHKIIKDIGLIENKVHYHPECYYENKEDIEK